MKRYIRVTEYGAFDKDEITKQDLIDKQKGYLYALIDTKNGTQFDADKNAWVAIE